MQRRIAQERDPRDPGTDSVRERESRLKVIDREARPREPGSDAIEGRRCMESVTHINIEIMVFLYKYGNHRY